MCLDTKSALLLSSRFLEKLTPREPALPSPHQNSPDPLTKPWNELAVSTQVAIPVSQLTELENPENNAKT
jgi:hypothetical protein